MRVHTAEKIAKAVSGCPEFQAFKAKWDRRIPRRGTKAFNEYAKDAKATQAAMNRTIAEAA